MHSLLSCLFTYLTMAIMYGQTNRQKSDDHNCSTQLPILNFSGKSTTSGPLENMHSSAKREKKQLNILLMVNKLWFKSCTL